MLILELSSKRQKVFTLVSPARSQAFLCNNKHSDREICLICNGVGAEGKAIDAGQATNYKVVPRLSRQSRLRPRRRWPFARRAPGMA